MMLVSYKDAMRQYPIRVKPHTGWVRFLANRTPKTKPAALFFPFAGFVYLIFFSIHQPSQCGDSSPQEFHGSER